jgi:dephospho-CoA kinase
MTSPLKIGITGGIGSGKTTVSNLFSHLGIPVYSSDDRARWLMNNNRSIIAKVNELFGPGSYVNNELNRQHISAQAFSNQKLIEELNQVVHPAVFADFDEWVASQSAPYILKEAALLFESNSYLGLDAIITVDAPLQVRIERTMQRDHVSEEAVMKRINNQMPDKAKREAADYVIINDSSEPLLPQVLTLHDLWTA